MIYHDHKRVTISGDTMSCADCGLQWDTNDIDPPACVKPVSRDMPHRTRLLQFRDSVLRGNNAKKRQ